MVNAQLESIRLTLDSKASSWISFSLHVCVESKRNEPPTKLSRAADMLQTQTIPPKAVTDLPKTCPQTVHFSDVLDSDHYVYK
ncbi:hypothetical protein C8R48DRAFT_711547 [Suillus tomentosus]|nr:hypothetical protein C8R48DRAFT_711547 [Suillus tomentosus]